MRFVACLFLVIVCACSNKPGEAGSCRNEGDNSCTEFTAAQAAAGKRMCSASWLPGEKSCPTSDRLGTCASKDGAKVLYAGPPNNYTAASAKSACEFGGGVFTSP